MNNRAVKIGAFCSVLINMLLVGIIAGYVISEKKYPHRDQRPAGLHAIVKSLPEEKARWYENTLKASRKHYREKHKQIKAVRKEAMAALVAEKFDAVLFKQKMTRLHQLRGDIKQRQIAVIVRLTEDLSLEQRKALSKHLLKEKSIKRGR